MFRACRGRESFDALTILVCVESKSRALRSPFSLSKAMQRPVVALIERAKAIAPSPAK